MSINGDRGPILGAEYEFGPISLPRDHEEAIASDFTKGKALIRTTSKR